MIVQIDAYLIRQRADICLIQYDILRQEILTIRLRKTVCRGPRRHEVDIIFFAVKADRKIPAYRHAGIAGALLAGDISPVQSMLCRYLLACCIVR